MFASYRTHAVLPKKFEANRRGFGEVLIIYDDRAGNRFTAAVIS
jgi:hypothetical protein